MSLTWSLVDCGTGTALVVASVIADERSSMVCWSVRTAVVLIVGIINNDLIKWKSNLNNKKRTDPIFII